MPSKKAEFTSKQVMLQEREHFLSENPCYGIDRAQIKRLISLNKKMTEIKEEIEELEKERLSFTKKERRQFGAEIEELEKEHQIEIEYCEREKKAILDLQKKRLFKKFPIKDSDSEEDKNKGEECTSQEPSD